MQGHLVVAGGRWSQCQGDREHLGSPPLPTETQEKRVPSAQPPALLLVGKFPAGGEGKEVGSSPEPYKPQRLRRVVRPCLAFLPAAAGTSPPAPWRAASPSSPSAAGSMHRVSLYVRSLCLALGVGRPPPALGSHYLVSGRLSSLLWAQRRKTSRAGRGELLVRTVPPPPPPQGLETTPRQPSPPPHQLLAHLFSSPPNRGRPQASEPLPPEGPPGLRHSAPEC